MGIGHAPSRSQSDHQLKWVQGLEVEFVSGRVYQYFGVPEILYRGIRLAKSKGEYLARSISNRFPNEEVRQ
jgi:hypothetical protein